MIRTTGLVGACAIAAIFQLPTPSMAADATVITLTQTGCQFLEPEGKDHGYTTSKKEDCVEINAASGADRLASSDVMTLKPGKYIFRVKNENVPYDLGFWFRHSDYDWRNPLHQATKVSVSGGGLQKSTTKDYVIELKAGEYVFSCPLNPTPDYRVTVAG